MEQKTEDTLCNIFFSMWVGILGLIVWGIDKLLDTLIQRI